MSQTMTPPASDQPAAAPAVPPDPIIGKSYSVHIALAAFAVVAATALVVVDEMWLRRPYKKIQGQYREAYTTYLDHLIAKRAAVDETVRALPTFKELTDAADAENRKSRDAAEALDAELQSVTRQGRSLSEAIKSSKSEISALSYEAEDKAHGAGHAKVEDAPESRRLLEEVEKIRNREITYSWKARTVSGRDENDKPSYAETDKSETGKVADLLDKALAIEARKAELQTKLGETTRSAGEAVKARDKWLAENLGNVEHALQFADDETRRQIAASGVAKYLSEETVSLPPATLATIKKSVEDSIPNQWYDSFLKGDIKQIHVADFNQVDAASKSPVANWIDRCETCHLNTRAPMPVTLESLESTLAKSVTVPAALGEEAREIKEWPQSKIDSMPLGLFTSHPDRELLKKHDPERFGCSTCHNGNGVAITNTELAHGKNHDWLWPLFPKENIEAGCVQCHQTDLVLPMGDRVTAGKDTFRRVGCWGCHKYEGFNKELDQITAIEGRRKSIEEEIAEKERTKANLEVLPRVFNEDDDKQAPIKSRESSEAKRRGQALQQEIAQLAADKDQLDKKLAAAYLERQRVGPNLKDVRVKIRREFLTDWIKSPRDAHKDGKGHAFRPDTKMPTFRWVDDEEVKDAAAFIWQSANDPAQFPEMNLPAFVPGDAARGEKLFKDANGCLICHSIGTGADRIGNDYAANLSNLGEKNRPEYVMRWITDPRTRLVAYDPRTKKDVSGASKDDAHLVWVQHTMMPNFRLSESDARDIATYLTSQKRADAAYEAAPWLDDASRMERGRKIVLYQGCAGCHEIKGLEDEKGIGTELTIEGSKPLDRLDFGHLTTMAERGEEPLKDFRTLEDGVQLFPKDEPWYRPRNFFLHKLAKPDIYDTSKYLPDRFNRLRMPQFKFSAQEILDVTTFVLGSVETKVPESFRYKPDEAGQAIREGWWVVKKYNCQGCHQVMPLDQPSLWNVPFFAEKIAANARDQFLPPTLVGVGARLHPEWMAKFLRDPSLGGGRAQPKSVRAHLDVRMPTFSLSDDEISKLVRFFQALSKQSPVVQQPEFKPLSDAELKAANAIWKSANCMQCHVVNGMKPTDQTKAPNLSYVPQRLNAEWMHRWIRKPTDMNPATAMTKFFGEKAGDDGRWHFMTALPELSGITEDHAQLMVRYLLQGLAGK